MPTAITRGAASARAFGFTLYKYTPSGLYWAGTISGLSAFSLVSDSSNNIYGSFIGSGSAALGVTIKISSLGVIQWQKSFGTNSYPEYFYQFGITIDSSNNTYTAGYFNDFSNPSYITIVKYDSAGTISWQRKISNASNALSAAKIAYSTYTSSVNVIGAYGANNFYGAGIDASSLTLNWYGNTAQTSGNAVIGYSITESNATGYFYMVGGYSVGGAYYAGYLEKRNSTGGPQFAYYYDNIDGCFFRSAKLDSSANIVVCGNYTYGGATSGYLIKISPTTPSITWQTVLYSGGNIVFKDLSFDSSGNIYVIGQVGVSPYTTVVVKYNSSGVLQWQRSISPVSGATSVEAYAINIDSAGSMNIFCFVNEALIMHLPNDGSLTGNFTVGSYTFSYAAASNTSLAGSSTQTLASNITWANPSSTLATTTTTTSVPTNTITKTLL